jgi:predicted O-methyltransferase YrrM
MHLPYPGFIHFGHFMPQCDINALHLLASKTWAARGRPLIMAEVGSFTGASALALVNYAERLYCIDTWQGGGNHEDTVDRIYQKQPERFVLNAFEYNTRHVSDKIVVCKESSLSAAVNMGDLDFDLVFLDADHRYEAVKADIQAWLPLVRPGGIMATHDFGDQFPGVRQAVTSLIKKFSVIGNVAWWET